MDNTPQHHLQQPTEVAPSTPSTTTPSTKKRTQNHVYPFRTVNVIAEQFPLI